MAVRDIFLDTNAYAAFKRGLPEAVDVLAHAPRMGSKSPVLGALLSGIAVGTRAVETRQEFEQVAGVGADTPGGDRRGDGRAGCGCVSGPQTPWPSQADQRQVDRGQRVAAGCAVCSDDGHFHEVAGLHVGMQLDDFLFCEERPVSTATIVLLNFWHLSKWQKRKVLDI